MINFRLLSLILVILYIILLNHVETSAATSNFTIKRFKRNSDEEFKSLMEKDSNVKVSSGHNFEHEAEENQPERTNETDEDIVEAVEFTETVNSEEKGETTTKKSEPSTEARTIEPANNDEVEQHIVTKPCDEEKLITRFVDVPEEPAKESPDVKRKETKQKIDDMTKYSDASAMNGNKYLLALIVSLMILKTF